MTEYASRVARSMLTTHPYTNWPLHVKLFTTEALKGWTEACEAPTLLPLGFTVCVELEGVDGKCDNVGSGREGPIDVTDSMDLPRSPSSMLTRVTVEMFTSEHLAKHNVVLSSGVPQTCTICGSNLDFNNIVRPRPHLMNR